MRRHSKNKLRAAYASDPRQQQQQRRFIYIQDIFLATKNTNRYTMQSGNTRERDTGTVFRGVACEMPEVHRKTRGFLAPSGQQSGIGYCHCNTFQQSELTAYINRCTSRRLTSAQIKNQTLDETTARPQPTLQTPRLTSRPAHAVVPAARCSQFGFLEQAWVPTRPGLYQGTRSREALGGADVRKTWTAPDSYKSNCSCHRGCGSPVGEL